MPGGVPWSAYVKMLSSSLLAMCAGAQVVHWYYRPDLVSAAGLVPILGRHPAFRPFICSAPS